MITSVQTMFKNAFKFAKIFSEHKGHTLKDVIQTISQSIGQMIFIYQADPRVINIMKVREFNN